MKKTILSASVATILAATSFGALADGPNFYGRLDLATTYSDNGSTLQTGTNSIDYGESGTYLENNFSWLGVKGSESIGNNLDIIYQVEFGNNNTSSGDSDLKARNTFLGLKTNWGTVLAGRNDTVFKQSEGGFDQFGNTNADMDRILAGQTRSADGLWYYSPKIANLFTINATYLFDDNNDEAYLGGDVDDSSLYAVTATFGDKKLKENMYYAAIGYNNGIGGVDAYRALGQIKLADFKIGALYQNSEAAVDGDTDDKDTFMLSVAYAINAQFNLKAQFAYDESAFGQYANKSFDDYGVQGAAKSYTDNDAEIQSYVFGADYRVAKSTLLYGHYAYYQGEYEVGGTKVDLDDDNVFTIGVRYDF